MVNLLPSDEGTPAVWRVYSHVWEGTLNYCFLSLFLCSVAVSISFSGSSIFWPRRWNCEVQNWARPLSTFPWILHNYWNNIVGILWCLLPVPPFSVYTKSWLKRDFFVTALVETSHGISHRYLCAWNQTEIKNIYRQFCKMSWEWSSSLSIPVTGGTLSS